MQDNFTLGRVLYEADRARAFVTPWNYLHDDLKQVCEKQAQAVVTANKSRNTIINKLEEILDELPGCMGDDGMYQWENWRCAVAILDAIAALKYDQTPEKDYVQD